MNLDFLLTQDAREELGNGFTSGAIDFWTDPSRKEQFGAFVVNLVAESYPLEYGEALFMSRETRDKLDPELFVTGNPIAELAVLEYPLNFEKFTKAKTIDNVVEWMQESLAEAKLLDSDFGHLSADGGSSAIGSVREFEMQGRQEGRVNSLNFNTCASHQNESACDYASGIGGFVENENKALGKILKKNHTTQTEINRNPGRTGIYRGVQEGKGREPQLGLNPGVLTRWQCKFIHFALFCISESLQLKAPLNPFGVFITAWFDI